MADTLLSIPSTGIAGAVSAQNYTEYTYTYIATQAQTYLTFEFRQDPSFWGLDDVSFTPSGGGANLLTNGGFESGPGPSNSAPGWTNIGVQGLQAAGQVTQAPVGTTFHNTHSGNYYWYDGAVGGVDGIYQAVTTTVGQQYTIDFWLAGDAASSNGPALAEVQVGSNVYSSVPANLTIDPASDTGTRGDGYTTDTRPTIDGSGFVGDTITLYDGAAVIGSGTVGNDGNWSVTPTSPLSGGVHSLSATQTDGNQQVSAYSGALTITLPPDAPTMQLATASDTATLGDGITSVTAPTITGTGLAGDTIALFENGTQIATELVGPGGTWSYTPGTLTDGVYHYTATDTDTNGNTSPISSVFNVTVDTIAPLAPSAPSLAPASDSGAAADGITNVAAPTFTGTAEAGSIVQLFDGATSLGTAVAASNGSWSFTSGTLMDGSHAISATATDAAGNTSPLAPSFNLLIDTLAPTTTIALQHDTGLSSGDLVTSDPALTGSGDPNAVVTIKNGGVTLGSTTADVQGNWRFSYAGLSDGQNTLTATETDAANNTATASVTFTLDDTPPAAPTVGLASVTDSGTLGDGLTNLLSPILTGTATVGSTVSVYDGATLLGTVPVPFSGSWSLNAGTLTSGSHAITATATDIAGNISAVSQPFALTIDTLAPALTATLLNDTGRSSSDSITSDPTLTGSGDPGATVHIAHGSISLGTVTADPSGNWSYSPSLPDGVNTLTVSETDAAGNTSTVPVALTLETAPPPPPSIGLDPNSDSGLVGDGITNDPVPNLFGFNQAGTVLTFYDGGTLLGTALPPPIGMWQFQPNLLSDGVHQITVTATDAAGNVSVSSQPRSVTIDTVAPAVTAALLNDTGPSATDRVTSDPTLTGEGDPSATVTITQGNTTLGTTTADAQGHWSFTPVGLTDGYHTLQAAETDAANNTGTAPAVFMLDTVAPGAASALGISSLSDTGLLGDGVTDTNMPVLTGKAAFGSTVMLYDGAVALGAATTTPDGSWYFLSGPFTDGVHTITAVVSDQAGNVAPRSDPFSLTIDTTPPTVTAGLLHDTGISATDGITVDPTLTGSGDPNALVTVFEGTVVLGTVTAGAQGDWTFAPQGLADGNHTLVASETDAAGNTASTSVSLTLDTAPAADAIPVSRTVVGVARYFDTTSGTQFFTSSLSESNGVGAARPDLQFEGVSLYALNPTVAARDPDATPVFRFFDTVSGTHFFTSSTTERDTVLATRPDLQSEGIGFWEHSTQQAGDSAVYRFFDTVNGTHFYTADANERASVTASRPDLHYEGVSFYAPNPS